MRMFFDSKIMKIIVEGDKHSIVSVETGDVVFNGSDKGKPSLMYGVLVKKGNYVWRGKLYYGLSDISFVIERLDKLERKARYE